MGGNKRPGHGRVDRETCWPFMAAAIRSGLRASGPPGTRGPRGAFPSTRRPRQAWSGDRAGNGALMRCAPLAIRWRDDPHRLVRESVVSAVPTHWDPRCGWSCALANLVTAAALRGETLSPDDLLGTARDGVAASLPVLDRYGYRDEIPSERVGSGGGIASRSELDMVRFDGPDMGFTLLSLQAALICYWQAGNFESAPVRDHRGGWRYRYQRRHRRCDPRREVRSGSDPRALAPPGGRHQGRAHIDGVPCGPAGGFGRGNRGRERGRNIAPAPSYRRLRLKRTTVASGPVSAFSTVTPVVPGDRGEALPGTAGVPRHPVMTLQP